MSFDFLNRSQSDSHKWLMAKGESKREDVLAFSVADSDYEVPTPIKQALQTRVAHGAFGYAKFQNTHRKAVRDWVNRRYHQKVSLNWILPAPKVLSAISAALLTFTREGDGVVIQTPVYHVFKPLIEDSKRVVIDSPLTREGTAYTMDYTDLENTLSGNAKAMILCSPHNPVGRVWRKEELEKVVALCKKHDVFLISDEIHADIITGDVPFTTVASLWASYEKMIAINAPSKTFNIAGLQSAYILAPHKAIREALKQTLSGLHMLGFNVLALRALLAAYNESEAWVDAQNAHIKKNKAMLDAFLAGWGVQSAPLEGTYLAWVDVSGFGMDSTQFCEALKQYGVVVSDGTQFGDGESTFVRINLACASTQLDEGLSRIAAMLEMRQ